jgi:hypothetical protein
LGARVWDLVLGNADGSSSMAASLSMVVERLEGRVDDALLHFLELEAKLELLGPGRNAVLTEDWVDAL